jgi:hypothetical protein
MKILLFKLLALFVVSLQIVCCRDFTPSRYVLTLPEPPGPWILLLGTPHWRLEWLDPGNQKQIMDILPGETGKTGKVGRDGRAFEIEIPVTWANPVTAWPYWPEHNLSLGVFKPAGAIFPLDVSGENLCLSWEAGLDSVFYRELALANNENELKIPANFDWQRFRLLFEDDALNEAVREDRWLVNWSFVAERTINANFDRRRLVPEASESLSIPVSGGPWYGVSPFAGPLYFSEDETPVFPVRPGLNVWISNEGILRCNGKTWVFNEWGN